jgi:hypothetical protein
MSNMLAHNNTLISKVRDNFAAGTDVSLEAGEATADHVAVFENYVDPTGVEKFTGSPWFPTGFYKQTLPRPSALHSMIDMRNGKTIKPTGRDDPSRGSPRYYVYPDAAGYTPAFSDVYSVSVSPPSGIVGAGRTITVTLEMDAPWKVTGTPKLSLNSGGEALYSAGSGTGKLAFTYRVSEGQRATDLAVVSIDLAGGTINDDFGNSANLTGAITTLVGLKVE